MSGIIGTSPNMKSGVVGKYPDGHIIQTTAVTHGTTNTSVSCVTDNAFITTVVTGSITPLSAVSSIIIHSQWCWYINNTSGDGGHGFQWEKNDGSGTSYPNEIQSWAGSGNSLHSWYGGSETGTRAMMEHMTMEDPVGGVNTAISYTLLASPFHLDTFLVGSAAMEGRWSIWFQEVQR